MGEVVRLKEAIATTATLMTIAVFPAAGQLRVVYGKAGAEEEHPQFEVRVRAPGAPDMVICAGPWSAHDMCLRNVQTAIR